MNILEQVMQGLQGGGISEISRQVGASESQVTQVVSGALPAMLAGLSKNTSSQTGLSALAGALDRDHDGGMLDNVMGMLGGGGASAIGGGILRHVLGGSQSPVESALGQTSGLDGAKVGQIMAMVAPLLMGVLGKTKRSEGLDLGGLASLLGGEKKAAEKQAPDAMNMLGRLIDSDGDGDIMDDVAKLGGGLLGGLFGGK